MDIGIKKQDLNGWFNYKFSFWFLVICFIITIVGFIIPELYGLIYLGLTLAILIILIRFFKTAIEMDK